MSYEQSLGFVANSQDATPEVLAEIRIPDFLIKASEAIDVEPEKRRGLVRQSLRGTAWATGKIGKLAFNLVANPYAAAVLSVTGSIGIAATAVYPSMAEEYGARSGWSTDVSCQLINSSTGEVRTFGKDTHSSSYTAMETCADLAASEGFEADQLRLSYSLADKNIRGMTQDGETNGHYGDAYAGASLSYDNPSSDEAVSHIRDFQLAALEMEGTIIAQPGSADFWRYEAYVALPKWINSQKLSWQDWGERQIEGVRNGAASWLEGLAGSVRTDSEDEQQDTQPLQISDTAGLSITPA